MAHLKNSIRNVKVRFSLQSSRPEMLEIKKVVENGLKKENNVVCTGGKLMIVSGPANGFHCPHFGTKLSPILISFVFQGLDTNCE